jgi:signal transduction histidine kinase
LPHPSVPVKVEIQVPVKRAERHGPGSNASKLTTSPAMSAASSLATSRRGSSRASYGNFIPHESLTEGVERSLTEWPFAQAFTENDMLYIEDASELVQGFQVRCWEDLPTAAVMFSLTEKGSKTPMAIVIVGLNYRRPFDRQYREWLRLLQSTLLNGLTAVRSTENEAVQQQSARQLDRAKEIFFSNIAHELKSPLTLISGPINDLLDRVTDRSSKTLLEMAQRNVSRLTRLISSLMDFSRIEAGRLQGRFCSVNVGLVTANLAAMWRSAIEKAGLTFVVQCDIEHMPLDAYIDTDCWEKILFNLLSNAYKYTAAGTIDVTLSYTQHTLELTVQDTGRGISRESLPYLTERFHRTQEAEESGIEGTGIGLAYASELIRLHGGHLSVESNVLDESGDGSHGSKFQVIIPLGVDHLDKDQVGTADMDLKPTKYGLDFIDEAIRGYREKSDTGSDTKSDYGGSIESSEESGLRGLAQSTLFFDKSEDTILVADDNIGGFSSMFSIQSKADVRCP